jgi:hypothetical protein
MQTYSVQVGNLKDLRDYVQRELCEQNELEIGAFHFTERILERRGAPCGIFFCLHGPRSVRLVAIWETGSNSILFYGSSGERVGRIQLSDTPALE